MLEAGLGVIQHTPNPAAAFRCLADQLRPGGRLAVDVYANRTATYLKPEYAMKAITRRLSEEQQLEWSILDTLDMRAPRYDKPQSLSVFRSWFVQEPLGQIDVGAGRNGYIGVVTRRPGRNG
jgi:hypothetical protein